MKVYAILCLLSLPGTAAALRYYLHMFQLNSYKPGVQARWVAARWKKWLLLLIPAAGGLFFWPRKGAKKPLVYTPRVKRMLGTLLALLPLWGVPLLAPWLVLLANALNSPAEKAIRGHYTRQAKQKLAAMPELTVIGVTGSYGKTSVKYYLNTLLRAKYNVFMTPEGTNTPMGVVRAVREGLTAAHEIFICEMGAKNVGDIRELCDLARPKHGVLTSIGPQHLESFKTLENVIRTKFELADALPPDGILFANGSDENIAARLGQYPHVIRYGGAEGYRAKDISVSERGTAFTIVTPDGEEQRMETRLLGRHNVVNLAGAAAVAHTLGVPLRQIKGQMRRIAPVPHRQQLIDRGDVLLIDDAYNSNPAGARASLETLALFEGRQKIIVTPGMIELGARQEELNRAFGAQIAQVCDFAALVGKAQTRPIAEGLLAGGFLPERLFVADTLQQALARVYSLPQPRKVILLENDLPDNF